MSTEADTEALLSRCYVAFNAREVEGALVLMHPDAAWSNSWEGGWVNGRDGVRHYWQRQWAAIDPCVEPRAFSWDAEQRVTITEHQIVRDLREKVLSDRTVMHVYAMQDGLVRRMEIIE